VNGRSTQTDRGPHAVPAPQVKFSLTNVLYLFCCKNKENF
jgi:hypothetical protein